MMKRILKNLCSGIALLSVVSVFSVAYAADSPVYDNTNEKTQRFLAQDLKTFIGLMELKRVETENILRLMVPPNFDKTLTVGTRMATAEASLPDWLEKLVRDTANYNMNTPEKEVDDYFLLAEQKPYCGDSFVCNLEVNGDDLLASTLLGRNAFENDTEANAAYVYARKLTNFKPMGMLPDKEMYKDKDEKKELTDEGVKHLTAVYQQMPAMTLAQNSLLTMHADRQRFKEFGKGLPIGHEDNKGASLMEMMAYEVDRRYMAEDWYKQMNQMSEAGMMREMAYMQAFELFLKFEEYKRLERMEALLAAQIGVMSQLLGQMAAATNMGAASAAEMQEELKVNEKKKK